MSDIDEEVRRAERMALAVASAPNMTSSKAKKAKELSRGYGAGRTGPFNNSKQADYFK